MTIKKLALALSTTCLIPFAALAADDEFGIADTPAEQPKPAYFNFIELGAGLSSDNPIDARRYSGIDRGGLFPIGRMYYQYRTPYDQNGSDFVRIDGQSFGFNSRRLSMEGGQQGLYKLSFGYELAPMAGFTGFTPFVGEGSDKLSLVDGWTRRASIGAITKADLDKMHPVDIKTERERFGSGLTWHVDPQYSLRMAARQERKEGLKAMGVYNGTASMLVPSPVNYEDTQVETELAYADKRSQWRVGYNMSLFRNDTDSFLIDNPLNNNARERMSEAPDNQAHSVYADGGLNLSDTTRLAANLSYSQYLQDETFLPYSINQNISRTLPRQSLDGRIATTTANLELTSKPLTRLESKTRYRFTNRHNDTPVSEFAYIPYDGTTDSAANHLRRNTPYSYKENLVSQDLGYAVTARTKVNGGYEFRTFQRDMSERAKNIDNTGYVGVRSVLADGLSGNVKYSHLWRDGSTYSPQGSYVYTNNPTWRAGTPYDNNPLLRKYYEADLQRDRIQAGMNWQPAEKWTLGASGGFMVDEYARTDLGLTDSVGITGTIDTSYQATPELLLTGFYTYDHRKADLAGLQTATAVAPAVPVIDTYARRWWINMAEDSHTIGMGSKWQFRERWTLLADYAFVWSVTETEASGASSLIPVGQNFPDIVSRTHSLSTRVEYDLTDSVVLGLGYAFELYRSQDWALDYNANSNGMLGMAQTSPNYDAHLFMVTTRAKF